ncbi:peptidase S41 [Echinicola pacifica]|uniref:Peptidase S41 n=1 Tax=Echinicola pacifica TaxID=346377 RepID=A0A918UPM5_9BACT|nr:S41 family peptidase [Echinicola pacifica]GGZ26598.1 peptidase S41 [Echinicola pacifica]
MKKNFISFSRWALIVAIGSLLTFSCKDDDTTEPSTPDDGDTEEPDPNIAVNEWIQDVMEQVYYWSASMGTPLALESDPNDYFNELLVAEDRFSVIYPNYDELVALLSGVQKEAGYDFGLVRASAESEQVVAVITYVKKNSPAESAGLRRNDRIYEVNGTELSTTNYSSVFGNTDVAHSLTISRYNAETGAFAFLAEPVSVDVVELTENPVFLDSVYTIGDKKIGYIVYNFFAPGAPVSSDYEVVYGAYDAQLDEIFGDFISKGVNEMILDLRYNGGGYTSSAVHLASSLGKGISSSDVFYTNEYNDLLQGYFTQNNGPDFFTNNFVDKPNNIGAHLSSGNLFVIATRQSASSSELVINGLKPYMNIIHIGSTTYGKNVGSTTFQDTENEDNHYGLLPIIFKTFNKNNESEYSLGFDPDVSVSEYDNNVFLYPLGDSREVLLNVALDYIVNGEISAGARINRNPVEQLGSSQQLHPRFGTMIESEDKFPH